MSKISEPIVFFGSGPVAAESLELLSRWVPVEAVITKPQPAHHKEPFPVLVTAEKLGLKVFTPNGKAELSDLFMNEFATKHLTSRLGIVIDYGFIINQDVIDYFPLGIINSHFSILPQWRGADPISFAILSGQKATGVSLMQIVAKMDEGPLLGYGEQLLDGTETTPKLTKKLILLSDGLLQHEIPKYLSGETKKLAPQSITGREASYSRKLSKDDGILDFHKSAEDLEREVRAYIEWPKSRTVIAGKDVIITEAHVIPDTYDERLGHIEVMREVNLLMINCSRGYLAIDKLKPAGKQEMPIAAFLSGYAQGL